MQQEKRSKIKELKNFIKILKIYIFKPTPTERGKLLSWHIASPLGLDINDINRIEFHEITSKSIKESINKIQEK